VNILSFAQALELGCFRIGRLHHRFRIAARRFMRIICRQHKPASAPFMEWANSRSAWPQGTCFVDDRPQTVNRTAICRHHGKIKHIADHELGDIEDRSLALIAEINLGPASGLYRRTGQAGPRKIPASGTEMQAGQKARKQGVFQTPARLSGECRGPLVSAVPKFPLEARRQDQAKLAGSCRIVRGAKLAAMFC